MSYLVALRDKGPLSLRELASLHPDEKKVWTSRMHIVTNVLEALKIISKTPQRKL
jgi:hypothetical protein